MILPQYSSEVKHLTKSVESTLMISIYALAQTKERSYKWFNGKIPCIKAQYTSWGTRDNGETLSLFLFTCVINIPFSDMFFFVIKGRERATRKKISENRVMRIFFNCANLNLSGENSFVNLSQCFNLIV